MSTSSFKIAKDVARNNSRRVHGVWVVIREFGTAGVPLGYEVRNDNAGFVPDRVLAAFCKGRRLGKYQ